MSNYTPKDQQARNIKTWLNPAELQDNNEIVMPSTREFYELQMNGHTLETAWSLRSIAKEYDLRDPRYKVYRRNPVMGTKSIVDVSMTPSLVKRDRFPKVTPESILADRVKELRTLAR